MTTKNLDDTDNKLKFGKDALELKIPAGKTITIVPSDHYKGKKNIKEILRYRCANADYAVSGILVITDVPPPYD